MTKTLTLAAAAAAVIFSAPALAADRIERVAYGDLNLATQDGQAKLQHRLDKAAHKVCMFDSSGQVATSQQADGCYRQVRKTAELHFAQAVSGNQRNG